jgi:hypothetical protein
MEVQASGERCQTQKGSAKHENSLENYLFSLGERDASIAAATR